MQFRAALLRTVALTALIGLAANVRAEIRTWTDESGKFSVDAELMSAAGDKVRLRREDGRIVSIAIDRLSQADQDFIAQQLEREASIDPKAVAQQVADLTHEFFNDLRTTERAAARQMLTAAAQKLADEDAKQDQSALFQLPAPDDGARSVRVGRAKVTGSEAEVPVQVRADGQNQKTVLHFRLEEDQWRVAAISAVVGDVAQKFDFETSIASTPQNAGDVSALIGQKIELYGFTLDGGQLDMSRYQGKVVLVDFWATWCGPCREEMPNVYANYQQYHDQGFEVIAVSVDDDLTDLRQFVAKQNPPWAVVVDRHPRNPLPLERKYNVRGYPTFLLLDRDGTVAAVNCRGQRLGEQLAKMLGATEQKAPDES